MRARDIMERFRARLAAKRIDMRFELRTLETVFGELANVLDFNFAQLADGKNLRHPYDFMELCRELQAVAALDQRLEEKRIADRLAATCPRCGHAHRSGEECEVDMGGAGKCGCKAELHA